MMDFLSNHAGVIGLLFFFAVFMVIIFQSFRPSAKKTIESYKYIPIRED